MRHASRGPGLGARAAGRHPRRQARSPGDAGQRPALPGGSCQASVHPGPRPVDAQGTRRGGGARRERGPLARIRAARRGPPGMRASGPRSQGARARRASTPGLGARTRREQGAMLGLAGSAGRRPASAPPGAVPRGCGPAARAPKGSCQASVHPGHRCADAQGTRRDVGARRERGPPARIRAARRGPPGMRASGPRSQGARSLRASTPGLGARTRREQGAMLGLAGSAGRRPASAPPGAVPRGCGPAARAPRGSFLASVHPGPRCADAQGTRRGVGARRERGPPARIRAARRGSPGMRRPAARAPRGAAPGERPPRASVRGRAGNKARCWGSPGARAAGPHPRRQARSPGMRASGPRSQGLVPGERPPRASVRGRAGNKARCWGSPGARAAGPHPRRQARSPGDAGQRPALPGGSFLASVHPGPRCADAQGTRRDVGARRERGPPARIRAARRGPPGMRASGPRSQGLVPCERPPRASVRGRAGNKARCWGSPGARAAGPHPRRQARFPGHAGQRPALPGARSRRASTPGLGARTRREQDTAVGLAGSAGAPRGLVPGERPPRASVRGRAGNKARCWGSPGARAAGPHPRRQARCWCSMGARGPRTEPCAGISPTAPPPRRAPPPVPPR